MFTTRNSKFTTRNSKFSTRNSKFQTRNSKFFTRNSKFQTRNSKFLTRNSKSSTRNSKFTTRNSILEKKKPSAPEVHQRFLHLHDAFDVPGGGAELLCVYIIYIKTDLFREGMRVLEDNVPRADLDKRLFV